MRQSDQQENKGQQALESVSEENFPTTLEEFKYSFNESKFFFFSPLYQRHEAFTFKIVEFFSVQIHKICTTTL